MTERKILLFILSVIAYGMYSVHMWFLKDNGETPDLNQEKTNLEDNKEVVVPSEPKVKKEPKKPTRRYIKDGCSVMQILTEKPKDNVKKILMENMDNNGSAVTVIGITVFLLVLTVNAILDVLKVKEEERARLKLNPDGERRQSLAEFANKKPLRRESSKFGIHLFQISETATSSGEEKKDKKTRQTRPYTRGDSTNSYLSERKPKSEGSAPASISETSASEPRMAKRQSVSKLIGGRPVPMVRRSSFPALPLNPEVQALMLGHRQASVDSDDEDGRGRRVRIIRRY